MPRHDSFDTIPTLTQRAEPTFDPPAGPSLDDAHAPVLHDVVPDPAPLIPAPDGTAVDDTPPPAFGHPADPRATPHEAVLRSALQAEIEQAVQAAMGEAVSQMRARLDAELPALVARAVQRVRQG